MIKLTPGIVNVSLLACFCFFVFFTKYSLTELLAWKETQVLF